MTANSKLIIYELNELPLKLLNYYLSINPNGGFGQLIQQGIFFNTFCPNKGELHPWSTWPTFHRGVSNSQHNINYINQDLNEVNSQYPPIWTLLNQKNITTGVFGSLQSYPPSSSKNSLFYLPDTFSPDSQAYPRVLSDFQQFNLKIVSQNKALAGSLTFSDLLSFARLFLLGSFSLKSSLQIFYHLLQEFYSKLYRTKRSLFQSILGFDLYYKYLSKCKPQFSSYFTNHLAGMMHRYWIHVFPEDFTDPGFSNPFYHNLVIEALDISDRHLTTLKSFCDKTDCELMIASSMGQSAIDRGKYFPEYMIDDFDKFISFLGLSHDNYEFLLSMQPDVIVECTSAFDRDNLLSKINLLTDSESLKIFKHRYFSESLRVNLSLLTSTATDSSKTLFYNGTSYSIAEAGFKIIHRHQGTAYHIPEGIVVGYGHAIQSLLESVKSPYIDTTHFKNIILDFYNVR